MAHCCHCGWEAPEGAPFYKTRSFLLFRRLHYCALCWARRERNRALLELLALPVGLALGGGLLAFAPPRAPEVIRHLGAALVNLSLLGLFLRLLIVPHEAAH